MTRKLQRDELEAEFHAVSALLGVVPDGDPVSKLALTSRRDQIAREMDALESAPDNTAEVALVFSDGPVYGSRAMDAEFAGKALEAYQELVSKRLAVSDLGGLAQRGPIPGRDASRLLVTDIIRGSFGFLLREARADEPGFVPSSLRVAVGSVTDMLSSVSSQGEEEFGLTLEEIDPRVFVSLRKFVETLYEHSASLRMIEGLRERRFDHRAITLAHERVTQTSIQEVEYSREITLLGLIPIGRRFEATDSETGEFVSGKVGPRFSQDYIDRASRGEVEVAGRSWMGEFRRKTVRRTDGRETVTITLINLFPVGDDHQNED